MKKLDKIIQKCRHRACPQKCEYAIQVIKKIEKQLEKDIMDHIKSIVMNCKFSASILIGLINDILDLAKLETSQINFNNDYFDLT